MVNIFGHHIEYGMPRVCQDDIQKRPFSFSPLYYTSNTPPLSARRFFNFFSYPRISRAKQSPHFFCVPLQHPHTLSRLFWLAVPSVSVLFHPLAPRLHPERSPNVLSIVLAFMRIAQTFSARFTTEKKVNPMEILEGELEHEEYMNINKSPTLWGS